MVTVRGVALTASDFADGGGYLADASGGIAVLLADGAFTRGTELLVTGELDDRYAQRTIRASVAGVTVLGAGAEPVPLPIATGDVGEAVEGRLVTISGAVASGITTLSGGRALDLDDGSGQVRVFVGDATGVDPGAWASGDRVTLVGVVGQRDSSGTGLAGYRVQPRDAADVAAVVQTATPSPSASATAEPTPEPTESPTPSASASAAPLPLVTIAEARQATANARLRIRGVVTVASGFVEPGSAVVQDASAAILLRLGDEAGSVARGELIEVAGTRSTKSGMLTLRVAEPPVRIGRQAEPAAVRVATGAAGEAHEARLVTVRGAVTGRASRLAGGGVSFQIDDGSGPLRVAFVAAAGLGGAPASGSWIEVRGALGQDTTGSQPQRGYRVWPRDRADVTVVAAAVTSAGGAGGSAADERTAGASGTAPRAGSTRPALTPGMEDPGGAAPRLSGARSQRLAKGSPAPMSVVPASDGAAPSRTPLGLVLFGLAGTLAAGVAGWRGGLLDRLRPRPGGGDNATAAPEVRGNEAELPLARLSLVGAPDPERP